MHIRILAGELAAADGIEGQRCAGRREHLDEILHEGG